MLFLLLRCCCCCRRVVVVVVVVVSSLRRCVVSLHCFVDCCFIVVVVSLLGFLVLFLCDCCSCCFGGVCPSVLQIKPLSSPVSAEGHHWTDKHRDRHTPAFYNKTRARTLALVLAGSLESV